jgi:hypothetical protein
MGEAGKDRGSDRPLLVTLFGVSMALYLLLGGRYGSGDTVPTSLATLNLLHHGTVTSTTSGIATSTRGRPITLPSPCEATGYRPTQSGRAS